MAVKTGAEQMEQALNALERVDELRESLVEVLRTKEVVSETESVDVKRSDETLGRRFKRLTAPRSRYVMNSVLPPIRRPFNESSKISF